MHIALCVCNHGMLNMNVSLKFAWPTPKFTATPLNDMFVSHSCLRFFLCNPYKYFLSNFISFLYTCGASPPSRIAGAGFLYIESPRHFGPLQLSMGNWSLHMYPAMYELVPPPANRLATLINPVQL